MSSIDEATNGVRTDARKDPATLEREIDQTRADMNRTLGALERKLSPGQLLDEAMGLAREHGSEFAANLGRSLKENPIPALLIAGGVVWMLASNNKPKSLGGDDDTNRYGVEPEGDYRSDEFDESDDGTSSWTETGQRAKDSARSTIGGIGQRAKAAAQSVGQRLSSSREAVQSGLGRTSSSARYQGQRARAGFQNLLEEQPLVIGALGVAIGAAIGAALPRTEQEDRLLGSMRDETLSAIKEQGSRTYEQVRGHVNRMSEEASQKSSGPEGSSTSAQPERDITQSAMSPEK